jgi:5-oxopent-3-ene-1,2,5-tricarboxylate decarboxylase/2-hydroxyhepta-2,4-diene-1,7-dioate isomerase
MTRETRVIWLDGAPVEMEFAGGLLRAADGRTSVSGMVIHMPPCSPSKIICVHLNYQSRLDELKAENPSAPNYFLKATNALLGHKGKVVRPGGCRFLNYEGEVALVMGRTARNVPVAHANEYIAGYTLANDFALHDFRHADRGSMLRVKSADTLAPVGPGLVRGWQPEDQRLVTRVNGTIVQEARMSELVFSMAYLVADLSRTMTLSPGDMIFTGTPANSRPVQPGDVITVECEGLGVLENEIVAGDLPISDEAGWMPQASDQALGVALGERLKE